MKLPRVRFSLRQLAAVVALAAVLIAGEVMRRRVVEYKRRSEYHAVFEEICEIRLEAVLTEAAETRTKAEWHGRMKRRYQRALWRPWMLMEPAPPPPISLPEDYDPR